VHSVEQLQTCTVLGANGIYVSTRIAAASKLEVGDDGLPPEQSHFYRLTQYQWNTDTLEWDKVYIYAIRSCYHIGHEKCMAAYWTKKETEPTPLDRVDGNPNEFARRLDAVAED